MQLRKMVSAALALALAASGVLFAQTEQGDAFIVSDIRIEGLQRISEGTVYNYLPVNIGDRLDKGRVQEALRAVFATGFFRDVELRREANTLIVAVRERPSIESFEIKGNKDIKTEDLQKSLRSVGLAAGKTFDQSTLDEVRQYLTDQYFARGKYAVRVDGNVEEVPGNKVKITIDVTEGKRAKIRSVNVVGNTVYADKQLVKEFKLQTPNWLSWYKQDDRYSREELSGDQEKLRSYYMDRGYANFLIDSTQVTITPENKDMFVTMNVTEGEVFEFGEVKIAGNLVVPEADLRRFVLFAPGMTYSRKLITGTTDLMLARLGMDGYAFAKIDPVPTIDKETHRVAITLMVDPGNRVYVRRINFNGATSVNDEVFRREMRQLEGAYLSNAAIERSKERMQRLPFIEKAEEENKPVPGTSDMVDVDWKIKEGLPGTFSLGIGYSEAYAFSLNGSFTHSNWMGSGERVSAEANVSKYARIARFSHTNPYTNIDGLSRTISMSYSKSTASTSASSPFDTEQVSLGLSFGYFITEYQTFNFGLTVMGNDIVTAPGSAPETIDWVRQNGNSYVNHYTSFMPVSTFDVYGTKYRAYIAGVGWQRDSRNRTMFATAGQLVSLGLNAAVPGSDVEYWTASGRYTQFVPLAWNFTYMLNTDINYGDSYGSSTTLPPYNRWFAGGPDSVRGFRESRLGPKDYYGNPYGGNFRVAIQSEILLPMPEKWRNSARASLFFDIANVFSNESIQFTGINRVTPVDYKFSYDNLKRSTGIAVQWLAPLGVFRFSYAIPLNNSDADGIHYQDETEGFQFTVGQAF